MRKAPLLILYLLLTFPLAKAQIPNYLLYDPDFSQHFGSENIVSIHHLMYSGTDSVIPAKLWTEDTWVKKGGGVGYRLVKLGLLDLQMDWFMVLVNHEAFGHGARMREFGFQNIRYELHPLFPYGEGSGSAGGSLPLNQILSPAQSMGVAFSGNEANTVLSDNLQMRMLLNGQMHYREGLLYLTSRHNLLYYTFQTHFGDGGGGDINNYLFNLNGANPGSGYTAKRLFMHNLVAMADPVQVYAAWAVGKTYVLDGKTHMKKMPMIPLTSRTGYLPSLNYNLTPFGGEFYMNNYFVRGNQLLLVKLRTGDFQTEPNYGLGFQVMNLVDHPQVKVNAEVEVWRQPAFQLGGEMLRDVDAGMGTWVSGSASYFPFKKAERMGIHAQLGYKTAGYVRGLPLDKGLVWRGGLAMKLQ